MNTKEAPSAEARKRVTSHFEMNLAEFPLTRLSTCQSDDLQAIAYQDRITGKNGEVVERSWTVTPSATHGFGSPRLLSTLFEVFQIWREDGFTSRRIPINSLYNLVQR